MYTNVIASSVTLQLYLRHDFYKIVFKSNINYIYSLRVSYHPSKKKKNLSAQLTKHTERLYYYIILYYIILYYIMLRYVTLRYIVLYYIILYYIISYHIISYHIISYHTISYHIISYHISYHIISYHIKPYHIISYHIISYHIISYHIRLLSLCSFIACTELWHYTLLYSFASLAVFFWCT